MQGIPIVVSRLTNSGTKQIYTIHDHINDSECIKNFFKQTPQFTTLDNCKQRQNKVRIRRIQSSGSKRKFPKDFFSRQSHRSNKNRAFKQNTTIEQIAKQTGCFATINQQNLNIYENELIETPKFQEKNHTQRLSNLYKNQTLNQSLRKFMSKKTKQPQNKITSQKQVMSFQNTFSGKQLRLLNQECVQLDLRAILKPNSQNAPAKKMKAIKQNYLKKFSIVKDKTNMIKQKNLRD